MIHCITNLSYFVAPPLHHIAPLFNIISITIDTVEQTTTGNTVMKIHIWSDYACPFCYIGKVRFENALKNFAYADSVEIEYKSFELYPQMTTEVTTTTQGRIEQIYGKIPTLLTHTVLSIFPNPKAWAMR